MDIKNPKAITTLAILLAISLAAVSFGGGFFPGIYEREVPSMAAQGAGQDLVDLFLVVPLLLLSLVFLRQGSRGALFVFGGTVFYVLYSFVIYAFGVHFNAMFFLYCTTLGLGLYLFVLVMIEAGRMEIEAWFGPRVPSRSVGSYLLAVAAMFYALWLKDTLPAVVAGSVPKSVSDYGLLVNPVHVLDMAVALPGLIVTAILLFRKGRLGYILAPMALVFTIILAVALAGMVVMVQVRGLAEDAFVAVIFLVLAVVSAFLLYLYLRSMKAPAGAPDRAAG
jgi:hypothetical protein